MWHPYKLPTFLSCSRAEVFDVPAMCSPVLFVQLLELTNRELPAELPTWRLMVEEWKGLLEWVYTVSCKGPAMPLTANKLTERWYNDCRRDTYQSYTQVIYHLILQWYLKPDSWQRPSCVGRRGVQLLSNDGTPHVGHITWLTHMRTGPPQKITTAP